MSKIRDRLRASALAWLTLCGAYSASLAWPVGAGAACASPGCVQRTAIAHASDSEGETEESEEGETETEAEPGTAGESEEAEGARASETTHGNLHSGKTAHHGVSLSGLALTAKSRAELRGGSPTASAIGFTLSSSARTKLRVTLLVQSISHGRIVWFALTSDSLTLGVAKGRGSHSLSGHNRLASGTYRLTVKPAGGTPRSIYLTVGR